MSSLDEFTLIRSWNAGRQSEERLKAAGVRLGIGDDAAIVAAQAGRDWLFTMDTMAEGIHFLPETMGDTDIGYKLLAANVSDIAAMGGLPLHAMISASVPPSWGAARMQALFDGLYACAEQYGVTVVGGDTTASREHLVLSAALTGVVEIGRAVKRSGAGAGELVFVTGPVGLSAGGLYGLLPAESGVRRAGKPCPPERLVQAHRRPSPSVKAGRLLAERGWASSLNDVSDGVASEAWEIAEASGVRLVLKEAALPLAGELAAYASDCRVNPLEWMLFGGEDYVLLGTLKREAAAEAKEKFRTEGLPFFVIGETEAGNPGVVLEQANGQRRDLDKKGYNHFVKG